MTLALFDRIRNRPPLETRVHRNLAVATDEIAAADLQTQQPNAYTQALAANQRSDLDPVAGVSLQLYVTILRAATSRGYEEVRSRTAARAQGVSDQAWTEALDGWNQRLRRNPEVATAIYDGLTAP